MADKSIIEFTSGESDEKKMISLVTFHLKVAIYLKINFMVWIMLVSKCMETKINEAKVGVRQLVVNIP